MAIRMTTQEAAAAWMKKASAAEIVAMILSLGPEKASEIGVGLYLAGSGTIASTMDAAFARARANPKQTAARAAAGLLRGLFGD